MCEKTNCEKNRKNEKITDERDRLTLWRDVDGYDTFFVVKRKFLIENNAELIEDNAKVVVSKLIAKKLEKAKRESIEIECGKFIVHCFAWRFLGNLSNDDISKEELSFKKIVKIFEGTTFDKNGWEVEKPKHWEAKEGEIVWFVGVDGIVSNLIVNAFTRQVISVLYESKNHFQTKEEAEAKVELIRSALRGEG